MAELYTLCWERDELLDSLMERLSGNPADIPVRFTSLHLYWLLSQHDPLDLQVFLMGDEHGDDEDALWQKDQEAYEMVRGFERDLAQLVHHLEVGKVAAEWRVIRWEIMNSYGIGDLDRALALYNRAEELEVLPKADLYALRGQFRFLRFFGPKLDEDFDLAMWEPRVHGPQDFPLELLLFLYGLLTLRAEVSADNAELDILQDAANDLEKATRKRPNLSPAYCSMLARCCFLTQRYHDAAKQYERILDGHDHFSIPELRQMIYKSVVLSYRQGGETQEALAALQKYADEFPKAKGVYLQMAELHALETKHDAVVQCIRNEIERNPDLDRDWKLTTILVLGETRDISERLLKELKSNRDLHDGIENLMKEFWPPFENLSAQARGRWIIGTCLMHFPLPNDRLRMHWLELAAASFAAVVEVELREKVFSTFREHAAKSKELVAIANQGRADEEVKVFCKFLLNEKAPLSLGQMAHLLNPENCREKVILQHCPRWVQGKYPTLTSQLPAIFKINEFRKAKTHVKSSALNRLEIPRLCREVVESLSG